jgi:uncharacterized protein YjaZ
MITHKMKLLVFALLSTQILYGQSPVKIFTSDIDNFWNAYDKVIKLSDTTEQKKIIQELYLDKATEGLKHFIKLRNHSASRHLRNILKYPKFWGSIRPNTLGIKSHSEEIQKLMDRFKEIYPAFKQPDIYFTIGILNSGGTTMANQVLIGSEIGVADALTDASELSNWLQQVFKASKDVVYLVIHEVVHTQQKMKNTSADLLTTCLQEGSADFITELLLEKQIESPYIAYGLAHEKELWEKFKNEMHGTENKDWLYNGSNVPVADLGYFMGYTICKTYYSNSPNKKKAIEEILGLVYGNTIMTNKFLIQSGYAEK